MPWGAEMGGGCVTATFLGFGSILCILVAGLGQVEPTLGSWTQGRRDLDVQGDHGPLAWAPSHPLPHCQRSGNVPPWLWVSHGTGRASDHGGWHGGLPFPSFLPLSTGTAAWWEASESLDVCRDGCWEERKSIGREEKVFEEQECKAPFAASHLSCFSSSARVPLHPGQPLSAYPGVPGEEHSQGLQFPYPALLFFPIRISFPIRNWSLCHQELAGTPLPAHRSSDRGELLFISPPPSFPPSAGH